MTDRSVSWTDAESVAVLLRRISAPRPGTTPAPVYPPGPAYAPPATTSRSRPAPPAPTALARPLLSVKSAEPKPVPRLEHTSDNPSDRLDALVAWTLDHHRCSGAFVADDNGLTLAAHGISEAHVSLVGPLLSAIAGIRNIPGIDATAGALWLGPSMMSWVEARTDRGGFCLGAVGPEALPTRALDQLKEALETTVRGL